MNNNKIILIFFGSPGSGKGTQAEMISRDLGLPNVSSGELLRREIAEKTKIGKAAAKIVSSGKLVSDEIVKKIIYKRTGEKDAAKGFILDGYPRNKKQLNSLIIDLNLSRQKVFAIFVEVGDKEIKSRLGGRRVCGCGATYHLKYNPPKKKEICDICGNKLIIRKDDKPGVIKDRLKVYHKEIKAILKYWEKEKKLIKVNGEQEIKDVYRDIKKELKKIKL